MNKNNAELAKSALPQHATPEEKAQREYQLALARTSYNYMFSYLEPVPLSADLPKGEAFSLDYEAQVLRTFAPMAENFKNVIAKLLEKELVDDMPEKVFSDIEQSFDKLKQEMSILHPERDLENLKALMHSLSKLPSAVKNISNVPKDVEKIITGLAEIFAEFEKEGPTAFLKSTMFDMLSTEKGRDYLQALSSKDYKTVFDSLEIPQTLNLERKSWMDENSEPYEQDWFFGYLQIGGFNTTNLRGVILDKQGYQKAHTLAGLQEKFPITDAIFQQEVDNSELTLHEAARQNRLFIVDYAEMEGAVSDKLNGQQRYLASPIALFYWNPNPPKGYPLGIGVLQPIAIQLGQKHDTDDTPIFTPKDASDANDAHGFKWKVAKYIVNVMCAIQHETVAHLGDCHLIVEPIVVAAHRQLSVSHPLLKLLTPHFRFTININDTAIHSLIAPGGTVATNVGPSIESTLELIAQAHKAWRWDENNPDNVFSLRGVDTLPSFPFREDTVLLWEAIQAYVSAYLNLYYSSDTDVIEDDELQAWIHEMTCPLYAGFKGMDGLKSTGDKDKPYAIDSLKYLIQVVSQIIYIAGPQHASVNYAQYPLMSFAPSVSGTIYKAPPSRSTELNTPEDCIAWYPPLDVALYTASFEYLLSSVQYDRLGQYTDNVRYPYFKDKRVQPCVEDFQARLSLAEIEIKRRNEQRPMPYPFQLPSQVPNSISI
ncbi:MAG: arachidonate 15-lipoxygenase [Oleiphilaceae bacterium]|jgi:arachidonate 15-lipoxygenase